MRKYWNLAEPMFWIFILILINFFTADKYDKNIFILTAILAVLFYVLSIFFKPHWFLKYKCQNCYAQLSGQESQVFCGSCGHSIKQKVATSIEIISIDKIKSFERWFHLRNLIALLYCVTLLAFFIGLYFYSKHWGLLVGLLFVVLVLYYALFCKEFDVWKCPNCRADFQGGFIGNFCKFCGLNLKKLICKIRSNPS